MHTVYHKPQGIVWMYAGVPLYPYVLKPEEVNKLCGRKYKSLYSWIL